MLCGLRKKKLFEYAMGELNNGRARKIEKHLKRCSKCRQYLSCFRKINSISAGDEQPFLNEVFWRKFNERLEMKLSQEQLNIPASQILNMRFMAIRLPRFAFAAAAVVVCVLLVFITSPLQNYLSQVSDQDLVETAFLIEEAGGLNYNSDEEAYVEEMLLQLEFNET